MAFDIYPAVDETYNFPPEIRAALLASSEFKTQFDARPTSTALAARGLYKKFATITAMLADTECTDGDLASVGSFSLGTNMQHLSSLWFRAAGVWTAIEDFVVQVSGAVTMAQAGAAITAFANVTKLTWAIGQRLRGVNGEVYVWCADSVWHVWDLQGNVLAGTFDLGGDVGYDSGPGMNAVTVRGGLLTFNFSVYSGNQRGNGNSFGQFRTGFRPIDGNFAQNVCNAYNGGYGTAIGMVQGDGFLIMTVGGSMGAINAMRGTLSWRIS